MNMNRSSPSAWILTLCSTLVLFSAQHALAEKRIQQTELSAEGVESLVLRGGNGSARIATSTDDRIRVEVEVSPKAWTDENPLRAIRRWFLTSSYDDIEDLLDAVRIDTDAAGEGELRVGLVPAGSGRKDKVTEKWTITLPARMAVELHMDYAEVDIAGIEGGTEVKAGAGSVHIEVPRGDLRIGLQVGDVDVKSGSGSIGRVDLRSTVGSTRLWMNGLRIKYPNPPGPGSEVSVSGRGDDTVRVDVQVGDVSVDVGSDTG